MRCSLDEQGDKLAKSRFSETLGDLRRRGMSAEDSGGCSDFGLSQPSDPEHPEPEEVEPSASTVERQTELDASATPSP